MSALRVHVSMGLLLLMCTLTGHCGESAPPTAPVAAHGGGDAHQQHQHQHQQHQQQQQHPQDERRIVELVRHVEENRFRHGVKTDAPSTPDLRNVSRDRADKTMVVFPTDPKKKEKFLKHITGPLYFSPKCRKHVYRLYHHTRDCTIPAYFKRCARLLIRLAGSPQCTEG